MKKLIFIPVLTIAGLLIVFSSCNKKYLVSDLILTLSKNKSIAHVGDTLALTINASTTNDEITSITMTKTGDVSVDINSVADNKNYSCVKKYVVTDSVGTLTFTVILKSSIWSYPFIKTLTVNIVKDVYVTLGTPLSTYPPFMNGDSLFVYDTANARTNQRRVDFGYSYSTTNGAMIGAPSSIVFNSFGWTTRNNTKIGIITEESQTAVSKVTGSSVYNLAAGNILGYTTRTGTQGIIEVMNVINDTTGHAVFKFMVLR